MDAIHYLRNTNSLDVCGKVKKCNMKKIYHSNVLLLLEYINNNQPISLRHMYGENKTCALDMFIGFNFE